MRRKIYTGKFLTDRKSVVMKSWIAAAALFAICMAGMTDFARPGLSEAYAAEMEPGNEELFMDDAELLLEENEEKIFQLTGFVQDDAALLSEEEEKSLEEKCSEIYREHHTGTYIVTTPDFGTGDIKNWQRQVFEECRLGAESSGSGVMLAVSMAGRDWGLVGFGAAQEAFTTYGRELIGKRILEDLSDGAYYDAFFQYLSMADEYLAAAEEGKPYTEEHPYGEGWRIPVVIGVSFLLSFAVSLGIVMSWKRSMNTRVRQNGAMEYMKDGSFQLLNRTDQFLYHTVSRTKRPKKNHSGGGGGMHSDRSGTSGKF